VIARALPAFQKQAKRTNGASGHKNSDSERAKSKNKARLNTLVDDTPKSFARLMQFHTLGKRLPKGLDDGSAESARKNKKRKLDSVGAPTAASGAAPPPPPPPPPATETPPIPKIRPGEPLADFAARVDQALPIAGLGSTDKQRALKVPGLKERTTKHNKRLERMQHEWREAERRRKEKLEEEVDELEEEREEHSLLWSGARGEKKKRKKRKGRDGPAGDEDDDPWKVLEQSRAGTKQRNLQDVVQAPPQLLKTVQSKLKVVGGGGGVAVKVGNVPGRVGSLRKREEMAEARRRAIEGYRKKMGRT
jgi:hypothetical protein